MNETRRNGNGEVLGPAPFDDRSYDDRQLASPYPSQPDNLPVDRALSLLDESIATLKDVRFAMRNTAPSKARRAELRRQLSGVMADCETVRIAIKE
jgi:hypothetical protein